MTTVVKQQIKLSTHEYERITLYPSMCIFHMDHWDQYSHSRAYLDLFHFCRPSSFLHFQCFVIHMRSDLNKISVYSKHGDSAILLLLLSNKRLFFNHTSRIIYIHIRRDSLEHIYIFGIDKKKDKIRISMAI